MISILNLKLVQQIREGEREALLKHIYKKQ